MASMEEYFGIAEERYTDLKALSDFIHSHPEEGFKEVLASERIASFLKDTGFTVEHPAFGYETAVCGRMTTRPGKESSLPCVCVIGEYDALSGLGHACGHNLIAAAGLSAAWTAAELARRQDIPLNLCFMGTPAEEQFGGKCKLLEANAFAGIDMAVMAHGSGKTETDEGALGAAKALFEFHGRASHAAAAPELGINALDAMVLFYHDMMQWKAKIHPRDRVHGIITNGGSAPNIIPDYTQAFFYVRSPDMARLEMLKTQLETSVKLGAEQTGCTYELKWVTTDLPVKVNPPLNERYARYWREAGHEIIINTGNECRASTDMGNVTQVLPGAQFRFSVNHEQPCALHSVEFREAAGTEWAFRSALETGAVMAHILIDYATDASFRASVKSAFGA